MRISYFFILMLPLCLLGQKNNEIHHVSGLYQDTIKVLWLPSSPEMYEEHYQSEIKILLMPWSEERIPDSPDFSNASQTKAINLKSIKTKLKEDSTKFDPSSLMLNSGVINNQDSLQGKMIFANMLFYTIANSKVAADLNMSISLKNPFDSEFIAYQILYDKKENAIGRIENVELPKFQFDSLKVSCNSKEAYLTWNVSEVKKEISFYNVMRSENSKQYSRINKTPIFHMSTDDEKEKHTAKFIDKNIQEGKKYTYYLEGIDHLGNNRSRSNIVEVNIPFPLKGYILIDHVSFDKNAFILSAQCDKELQVDFDRISKCVLYAANEINSNYHKIKSFKLSTIEFKESFKLKSGQTKGFVKLALVSKSNDTLWSEPKYFFLRDSLPPVPPRNLKGEIDTNGYVRLEWDPVDDNLLGYRVYRKNAIGEEFIEITSSFCAKPEYVDSISLNNLSSEIFYAVSATDQNYNSSEISEWIKLEKPDKIAPVPSFIKKNEISEEGIKLTFQLSSSSDFDHAILQKQDSIRFQNVLKTDKDSTYVDSDIEPGSQLVYRLITFDHSGNTSVSKPYVVTYEPGFRSPPKRFRHEINREERFVELSWANPKDVYAIYIYMARENEGYKLEKSLFTKKESFRFQKLSMNHVYRFKIQTMDRKGVLSKMSEELVVDY